MSDSVVSAQKPADAQTAVAERKPIFQEAPGEARASAVAAALGNSGTPPPLDPLMRLDSATRAEVVEQMQEQHGNQFVLRMLNPSVQPFDTLRTQRIVVQRENPPAANPPAGGTPAANPDDARKQLEDDERKAYDVAKGKAGQAAAKGMRRPRSR